MFNFQHYTDQLFFFAEFQKLPAYLLGKSLSDFFKFMSKSVRFKEQVFEDISRSPSDIIRLGGDCGEKTKLTMIYLLQNKIDFEVVYLKTAPNRYHVFCRVWDGNRFIDYDNSYDFLKMGERFPDEEIAKFKRG